MLVIYVLLATSNDDDDDDNDEEITQKTRTCLSTNIHQTKLKWEKNRVENILNIDLFRSTYINTKENWNKTG